MTEIVLPKLRVKREEARQKIQMQIEKGQQLRDQPIDPDDGLETTIAESKNWSAYNRTLLLKLFDNTSIAEEDHTNFDDLREYVSRLLSFSDELYLYQEGMNRSLNSLEGIYERLELYDEPAETLQRTSSNEDISDNSTPTFGHKVFIVHGHDEAAKHAVARFVAKFDIEPIILDEQASKGQTIITKFEDNADEAGFAIVLLTPDDVGASKNQRNNLTPRARQNVVLELGYFMAKLGRERVCPLLKDEVEKPSDIDGFLYVPMNNPNEWQLQLAREMQQAGLPIDLNKLA